MDHIRIIYENNLIIDGEDIDDDGTFDKVEIVNTQNNDSDDELDGKLSFKESLKFIKQGLKKAFFCF